MFSEEQGHTDLITNTNMVNNPDITYPCQINLYSYLDQIHFAFTGL